MASPCVARTARCLSASARRPIARRTAASASPAPRANKTVDSTSSSRAYYHSHDHPPSPSFGPVDRDILAAAYKHVPEHGFSLRAIGLGARDAGYPDISASVLPDGQFSLIRYHLVAQRERLADRSRELLSDEAPLSAAGVGEKVAALTWERLMGNKDVIHRWQEALAVMAQPSYLPKSLAELAALSDDIWFLAGDKAVDPSWYTKRAALSMVYSSSELFMTNDRSPNFLETRQFLHRRLGEVQSVGSTVGSVGQWVGFTLNAGVNVLRSKGVPI
ncbi:ubiquinone biosynthesis protein COQ9 [Trichoderma aethiopicum]